MTRLSRDVLDIAHQLLQRRAAPEQGGLLSGHDPTEPSDVDPLRLWIVQIGVIVLSTQLLALGLRKIRQPKVIAEVIGGILLGPTAFGRIPGFTQHIFPQESRGYLSLTANIGLCLFLFLVGLEIDAAVIKRNVRLSVSVAGAGMVLPFGLGAALAVPIYNEFIDPSVKFTNFMLFTGVAFSITAFPVLCRILTELKLLDTTVGIVVLSAGVGNDIIGWTLLALSVALVNAGSGLMALWILLTCIGWTLFLLFPVKMALRLIAVRTGSITDGPTMFFMTVTILLLFGSAFFTDIIGVHAIFGAFLVGLIVPREGGLAIHLTEKLEDMVSIIFLPLYFTLSGLSTDLGLLDNGITWGYTIGICALAYLGKMIGCTLAARFSGFNWREAGTIGTLMSCKGLVELIVLNVGLSAGILSQRVFSMFVLEALVLTFATTPVVTILYPPQYRVRAAATGANFANVDEGGEGAGGAVRRSGESGDSGKRTRFSLVLDKIEHLPGMMALTQLIHAPPPYTEKENASITSPSTQDAAAKSRRSSSTHNEGEGVVIDALRVVELSDRTSAVMKSSNVEALLATDPLLDIFMTFGALNGIPVTSSLSVVTFDDLASSVAEHAQRNSSQLVLVPWLPPHYSIAPSSAADHHHHHGSQTPKPATTPAAATVSHNPFDALFKATTSVASAEPNASVIHSQFVRSVFASCKTDVALYVDRHLPGTGPAVRSKSRLFVPFFGGPDDRLALEFAVQLCANPRVSATVVRIIRIEAELASHASRTNEKHEEHPQTMLTIASAMQQDTVYGAATTETRLQSDTADNILWARYTKPDTADPGYAALADALARIEFSEHLSPAPLAYVMEQARAISEGALSERARLLVVAGRSRRLAVENHHKELKALMEEHGGVGGEVRRTVGDVATALVVSGCQASVVVMQASAAAE